MISSDFKGHLIFVRLLLSPPASTYDTVQYTMGLNLFKNVAFPGKGFCSLCFFFALFSNGDQIQSQHGRVHCLGSCLKGVLAFYSKTWIIKVIVLLPTLYSPVCMVINCVICFFPVESTVFQTVRGKVPELRRYLSWNRSVPMASWRGQILLAVFCSTRVWPMRLATVSTQRLCLVCVIIRHSARPIKASRVSIWISCALLLFRYCHENDFVTLSVINLNTDKKRQYPRNEWVYSKNWFLSTIYRFYHSANFTKRVRSEFVFFSMKFLWKPRLIPRFFRRPSDTDC